LSSSAAYFSGMACRKKLNEEYLLRIQGVPLDCWRRKQKSLLLHVVTEYDGYIELDVGVAATFHSSLIQVAIDVIAKAGSVTSVGWVTYETSSLVFMQLTLSLEVVANHARLSNHLFTSLPESLNWCEASIGLYLELGLGL
jgi:hypothetical protein